MKLPVLVMTMAGVFLASNAEARNRAQVNHFRADHPCPATGSARGPCKGYVVDHVVPLCAGGIDHPSNMQWQSIAAAKLKDRAEAAQCRRQAMPKNK